MKPHPSDRLPPKRRERLFRLAGEEFASRGFEHASLNRIIAAAAMSKSSFYHYFENKADLFRRTVEHVLAPFMDGFEQMDFSTLQADTFWPTVRAMVRESTAVFDRSPEMILVSNMVVRAMENPQESEMTRGLVETETRWLGELIRRGQALGLVREDMPEDLLIAVLIGASTAFDRWFVAQWETLSAARRLELAESLVDVYVQLLSPPGSEAGTTERS